MKVPLLSLALLLSQSLAFGQGTVFFYNHVPEVGLDAPVFDTDGVSLLQGYQFQAQLYAGHDADSLMPVGLAASFSLDTPGYWFSWGDPLDRTIPDVPPGETAFCQVKVWSFLRGGTYDQVVAADGKHGQSGVFSLTTGGAPGTDTEPPGFPAYLAGLKSFALTGTDPIPEPSALVLAGLAGIGLVWWQRRRSSVKTRAPG